MLYGTSVARSPASPERSGSASWPFFDDDEISAAQQVLASGRVNSWTGQEVRLFELEFARRVGTDYAVAMANGTVALEAAFLAAGLGPGDEIVVTPRTFVASAGAAALHGIRPVFADVDPESQNITAGTVEPVLSSRTRAVLAVHLAGWPCEMDGICSLARAHNLIVVEDCAQAHGATYWDQPVGSLGSIAAWSFCQDKIITTAGEGGMVTTDDRAMWERVWSLKDHGKDYASIQARGGDPTFKWVHHSFGTNWRLTELQAAIGRLQLGKLPGWIAARRRNAEALTGLLSCLPAVRVPMPPAHIGHAYYKFYAFVRPEALRADWSRNRIIEEIVERGYPCYSGSCSEIYLEKAFADNGLQPIQRLPVAKELGETSLMFLVHPTLLEEDMEAIGSTAAAVIERATR